jgi:hypothetical protein
MVFVSNERRACVATVNVECGRDGSLYTSKLHIHELREDLKRNQVHREHLIELNVHVLERDGVWEAMCGMGTWGAEEYPGKLWVCGVHIAEKGWWFLAIGEAIGWARGRTCRFWYSV